MKNNPNVLRMIAIVASVGFCIVSAMWLFKEISIVKNRIWPGPTPTQDPQDAKLNKDLKNLVLRYREGEISVMDLSTVTPFEWDRVHIFAEFPGFMDDKDIDRILGSSWRQLKSCDYPLTTAILYVNSDNIHSSGYSLFIFTHESKVAHCLFYVDHFQAHVYTNSADAETGILREDALFIIDKQSII